MKIIIILLILLVLIVGCRGGYDYNVQQPQQQQDNPYLYGGGCAVKGLEDPETIEGIPTERFL